MNVKSLYPYLVTDNMEETLKFYTEVLGFTVKHDVTRLVGGHVIILSNEAGLQLELMDAMPEGPFVLNAGDHGLRMNVDDMDAAAEELKKNGFTAIGAPIETPSGKNLPLKDPIGTNITLIQHIRKD